MTAQEIVDQTNRLARRFYADLGYEVAEGYRFDRAHHPQELAMWASACIAQDVLCDTDAENALDDAEDDLIEATK